MSEYWDRRAAVTDPILAGTVTDEAAVVRLRDRLERAHLERVVGRDPNARVLEVGAGAGRLALWFAERCREVTLVDASAAQLAIAEAEAKRRGLSGVKTVCVPAQAFVPQPGAYDLILCGGILTCLTDEVVEQLVDQLADGLAPGGRLVLKEPITSDGQRREDRRDESYLAIFRPREDYATAFGRRLRLTYQRPTVSHPIPRWMRGTNEAAASVGGAGLSAWLLGQLGDVWERADPWLLEVETALREHPTLSNLLAPLPVLQDLYVFQKSDPHEDSPAPSEHPALSVVMIAFNEAECLESVIVELVGELDAAGLRFELVLVDDGSTDGTPEIMKSMASADSRLSVVLLRPNRGIGGALRAGFDRAQGDYVTWVPGDGQIGPDVVLELFRRRKEAPMLTTVYVARDDPFYRTVISRTLNTIIKLRTGEVAKSGGNYLFEREAWRKYAPDPDDSMMISTAFRHALRIADQPIIEVPVRARARVAGQSKVLNTRTIARTLASTLRLSRGDKPR